MNELQRQHYLAALGLDSYSPRWHLPWAPLAQACTRHWCEPLTHEPQRPSPPEFTFQHEEPATRLATGSPIAVEAVLRELGGPTRRSGVIPAKQISHAILETNTKEPRTTLTPFSLSIWRPLPDWLVIDERQTQLAFPTEILLHNILRVLAPGLMHPGNDEVLAWPMGGSVRTGLSPMDAQQGLQVWLQVELERRPVKHLLLMGKKAAEFFLNDGDYDAALWRYLHLPDVNVGAVISANLVSLLRDPAQKRQLWQLLQSLIQTS